MAQINLKIISCSIYETSNVLPKIRIVEFDVQNVTYYVMY